jgi:RNA recognition motif-containing protein
VYAAFVTLFFSLLQIHVLPNYPSPFLQPNQGFERSREPRAPTPVNPPSTRLFVANLGSANENQVTYFVKITLPQFNSVPQLMQALGAHKPVSKPVIVNDRETQRSKGFGFLEFATVDEAKAALAHLATVTMQGR